MASPRRVRLGQTQALPVFFVGNKRMEMEIDRKHVRNLMARMMLLKMNIYLIEMFCCKVAAIENVFFYGIGTRSQTKTRCWTSKILKKAAAAATRGRDPNESLSDGN